MSAGERLAGWLGPTADEHWAPDHVVLARRVLTHAGRLFVERGPGGEVVLTSPLEDMAAVEQRYPAWALGPFGRIEPEFAVPDRPGVYALVSSGVVHYLGWSKRLSRTFSARSGLGEITRQDCTSSRREEVCRLNRLIAAEAVAGRTVDLYLLLLERRRWYGRREGEGPAAVAAEILAETRGDWHLPE
jgi:hypothetical protein